MGLCFLSQNLQLCFEQWSRVGTLLTWKRRSTGVPTIGYVVCYSHWGPCANDKTLQKDQRIEIEYNGSQEIKLSQYADDTTALLSDSESVMQLFELLGLFERCSGLKINESKSELLWLGSWRHRKDKILNLQISEEPVYALGVHFAYERDTVLVSYHPMRLVSYTKIRCMPLLLFFLSRYSNCLFCALVFFLWPFRLPPCANVALRKR